MTSESSNRSALDWALLVSRLIVGVVFMPHGGQKLFGAFGGSGLAAFVQKFGPVGYLVSIGEFFGGLGLVVGFLPRFSAGSIIVIMVGAIALVHAKFGFFMNWKGSQAGEGFEYHLLAIGTLLPIVIVGPRRFTVARFLRLRRVIDYMQSKPVVE